MFKYKTIKQQLIEEKQKNEMLNEKLNEQLLIGEDLTLASIELAAMIDEMEKRLNTNG